MDRARLAPVTLPDFGMPTAMPFVPAATYAARLEGLRERAERRGYQHVVVYADRGSAGGGPYEGMALQADVIPATATDYFTTNIEDGLALADEALRGALAAALPGCLDAHPGSSQLMREALGIDLHPEDVLPFSNIPALPATIRAPVRPRHDAGRLKCPARLASEADRGR